MVDQNQAGVQVNGQPVMGGNPYDLIDNKGQEIVTNTADVPSADVNVNQNMVNIQQPIQQIVPQVQVTAQVPIQQPIKQSFQVVPLENKGPGRFTKKLVSFLAKLSGQPDPETGEGKEKIVANNTVNGAVVGSVPIAVDNQTVVTVNNNTKINPFDSIMGGVTGFLDKVEKKVESVAGIDLDAPIKRAAVVPIDETATTAVERKQEVFAATEKTEIPAVEEVRPIEKIKMESQNEKINNQVVFNPVVENSVEQEAILQELTKDKQLEQNVKVKMPINTEEPHITTVKAEIEPVEKNENVPVNPISENIQFGQSTLV